MYITCWVYKLTIKCAISRYTIQFVICFYVMSTLTSGCTGIGETAEPGCGKGQWSVVFRLQNFQNIGDPGCWNLCVVLYLVKVKRFTNLTLPVQMGGFNWKYCVCVCACVSMSLVSCGGTIRLRVLLSLKWFEFRDLGKKWCQLRPLFSCDVSSLLSGLYQDYIVEIIIGAIVWDISKDS